MSDPSNQEPEQQFKDAGRETTARQPADTPEQAAPDQEQETPHWIDVEEAKRAAHTEQVMERLEAGKINKHEAAYEMARYENDLSGTYNKDAGADLKGGSRDEDEKQQGESEPELSFVKDNERGNSAEKGQGAGSPGGNELTFVKDQNQNLDRGR